jgi:hypothetical protein
MSLIIKQLHKSLININLFLDMPIAFELEMNLLHIIKQQQKDKCHDNRSSKQETPEASKQGS